MTLATPPTTHQADNTFTGIPSTGSHSIGCPSAAVIFSWLLFKSRCIQANNMAGDNTSVD